MGRRPRASEGALRFGFAACRALGRDAFRFRGDVFRRILGHSNNVVGGLEVIARTAHHQYGRYPEPLVELAHAVEKRQDGLPFFRDQCLHTGVAHHEVRRRGVFVEKKNFGADFERFHDVRGLARATARVIRRKIRGAAAEREVLDERADVDA